MKPVRTSPARWAVLLLACLLAAACQDKRDPIKPSVSQADPSSGYTRALA